MPAATAVKMLRRLLCLLALLSSAHAMIIDHCVDNQAITLTFDDGPSIKTTRQLMDTLESLDVKGTFHVVTRHIDYPEVKDLLKEIISRGHTLGYRLEAEWTMQDVSTVGIQGAVDYRLEKIKASSGKKPKLVRTSFNATDLVKEALIASGLIVTVPNFETYDYKDDFSVGQMLSRFDAASAKSVISVEREFAANLMDTTKAFVAHVRGKGYKIVSLQDCIKIDNVYFDDKSVKPLKLFEPNSDSDAGETETSERASSSASPIASPSVTAALASLAAILLSIFI